MSMGRIALRVKAYKRAAPCLSASSVHQEPKQALWTSCQASANKALKSSDCATLRRLGTSSSGPDLKQADQMIGKKNKRTSSNARRWVLPGKKRFHFGHVLPCRHRACFIALSSDHQHAHAPARINIDHQGTRKANGTDGNFVFDPSLATRSSGDELKVLEAHGTRIHLRLR